MKHIDRRQIYKYAGYGTNTPDEKTIEIIEKAIEDLMSFVMPKWVGRSFSLDDMVIKDLDLSIPGLASKKLLESSHKVIFLAASLGIEVDRWIQRKSIHDLSLGFLYDAIASAAAESYIEELDYDLRLKYQDMGLFLTDRFSPGYGDVPIDFSKDICRVLDCQKKIGMYYSSSGLLIPRKSITAFLGVSKEKQKFREKNCSTCFINKDCKFRQKGVICHESH